MLPFGEYRPDIANYNGATSRLVQNVVPRADGYGPWKSFVPYSNAMPGATPNRGFSTLASRTGRWRRSPAP